MVEKRLENGDKGDAAATHDQAGTQTLASASQKGTTGKALSGQGWQALRQFALVELSTGASHPPIYWLRMTTGEVDREASHGIVRGRTAWTAVRIRATGRCGRARRSTQRSKVGLGPIQKGYERQRAAARYHVRSPRGATGYRSQPDPLATGW